MRDLIRDSRGATIVEFVLVVPLVLLFTVGFLDVARALNAQVVLVNASQEGAHYAILNPTAAPSAIVDATRTRTVPLNPTSITVTSEYYDGTSFVAWPSNGIPANNPTRGVLVRVSVSYPWSAVSIVAGEFLSNAGARTLTSSSVMETRR
jgi:Flp pilus assembly protein TadG